MKISLIYFAVKLPSQVEVTFKKSDYMSLNIIKKKHVWMVPDKTMRVSVIPISPKSAKVWPTDRSLRLAPIL